jgi:hypothetical protein
MSRRRMLLCVRIVLPLYPANCSTPVKPYYHLDANAGQYSPTVPQCRLASSSHVPPNFPEPRLGCL